jgi:nucleoside-diphosphate-sugar epimerase
MRIFIAGATGAVGAPLLSLLVDAGHHVTGTTHTPAHAGAIEQAGAAAVVMDGLDAKAVHAAVLAAKPDVVIHQMTALSRMTDLRRFDAAFATSNRLRTAGVDHLLAAARDAGAHRFIAQGFCGWPYARTGTAVKSEDDPLDPDPPRELRRSLDAIRHLERVVTGATASGIEGIVLRYGNFYGPDTGMLAPASLDQFRRRRVPVIGDGNGWWSFVHTHDAAAATAIAVERGSPGTYNIVDDDPAPARTWLPVLAELVGAKPPMHVPRWVGRLLAGDHLVKMMTEARSGSNAKAKRELHWQPAHASWREGFAAALAHERADLHRFAHR